MCQKIIFVLNFNFTGLIKAFSYDVFMKFVKPCVLELAAYLVQLITFNHWKALDDMKDRIERI
jgi:hypothetical protein